MPWLIEDLAGTKDGANKAFTISNVPVKATLAIVFEGHQLESVGSQPDLLQAAYVQDGTDVTLGIAPNAGQRLWAQYFHEP